MNMQSPDLGSILLARLRPFFSPARDEGMFPHSGQLFSYCSLSRERIHEIVLPHPVLGVVLRGAKELVHGGRSQLFHRGMVFVLPRNVALDAVNIPDETSGIYESLILPVEELAPGIRPRAAPRHFGRFDIALTPDLVEAIAHAATAIADPALGPALARLRLAELLHLLENDPVGQLLVSGDLVDRARWQIAALPDHDWTVAALAQEMAIGASTLRRRLDAAGQPFRQLLLEARMQAAKQVIHSGATVAEAASVAGYQSRSRFAGAYRAHFGLTPGADRKRA